AAPTGSRRDLRSARGDCGTSHADHDVGCLDDGPSLVSGLEIEIGNRFVRDCRRNDNAIADIDSDMGRRNPLLDFEDLTFELFARGQLLHGVLLPRIRPYGTTAAVAVSECSPSAASQR